jgi:hypothetical protein
MLMDNLLLIVAIALAVALAFTTLKALSVWYALKHQFKAPRGQFRITMPVEQWDKQVAMGAFAVAITDAKGQVYMTLLVQKGEKK